MIESTHAHTGMSLREWLARVPNELAFDAVGLWQVVPTLRHDFGLEGAFLEESVESAVNGLMDRGAVPVRCGEAHEPEWVRDLSCGSTRSEIVSFILNVWVRGPMEPTVGEIWFAVIAD